MYQTDQVLDGPSTGRTKAASCLPLICSREPNHHTASKLQEPIINQMAGRSSAGAALGPIHRPLSSISCASGYDHRDRQLDTCVLPKKVTVPMQVRLQESG